MRTLIADARLISPDLDIPGGALLLEDGRIAAVIRPEQARPAADATIDAGGCVVMPGFIDIHSHGADGHDVCDNTPEAVRHIARRKLQEGVTTWLPTTLTQPRGRLEEIAAKCAAYMAAPEFCRVPGLHVEGPFINAAMAGAQNPRHIRPPDFPEIESLHSIVPVRIVSLAPELDGALDFIRRANAAGIICSAAHTAASAGQIADAMRHGLRHLTHFCNAMTPLHHRGIGAVGAGLLDDALMLEIICDAIHLCPDMLRLLFKLVPIERLMMITDSTAASWLGRGEVKLGGLDVIVENGRAALRDGGALAGSALRFNKGLRIVAETTGLPLHQLAAATSWNQARALGLGAFGKLEAGFHADLVVLDADFSVRKAIVGGEIRGDW